MGQVTEEKKLNGGTTTSVKEFTAGEDTSFTFSGLDDGDYILTETATPAGYNTIKPITFTVTAKHNIEWTTGERVDVLTELNGNTASGEITFTADLPAGSLTTNVVNVKGSNLPSTGGMGTVLLYAEPSPGSRQQARTRRCQPRTAAQCPCHRWTGGRSPECS